MTACAAEFLIDPDGESASAAHGHPHLVPFELIARQSSGPAPRQ
jgi:hypothetical protein